MAITAHNTKLKPGYKQTEVGVIPEDWEAKTFGEVMTGFTSGVTPSRKQPDFYKGNIRWITSGELNYNVIMDTIEKISVEAVSKTNLKLLPKGTFLIAITGMEAEGTRGSCGIVGAEATTNQHCMALFPTKQLSTHYLFHYYVYKGKFLALQYCQGTKQQDYTGKIVKLLPILLPPLPEQQAIATALSDVDALIASLDRLIAKKRDIKQATMQQLLTGKTRLPGFSGEWEVVKLRGRCEFYSGGTPSTSNSSYYGGSISWINSSDLNTGRIKEVEGRITKQGFEKSSAKMVKKGDLLLALYGATAGVAAITEIDAAINQAVLVIIPQKDNSEFLFQKLTLLKDWLIKTYTQGGQPNLSGQIVKLIEFSLPPKPEQRAIAAILTDMDAEIAALEQKRDKTRALKQGMMQELLTGKTRLI